MHANRWIGRGALAAAAVLVALAAAPGAAQAGFTCTSTWQGPTTNSDWSNASNWAGGVPTSISNACIPGSATPVLISGESAQANSLTLTSGELDIEGTASAPGTLTLSANSSIGSGGTVVLEPNCTGSCAVGATSILRMSSGTLSNSGTIESMAGTGQANSRVLNGNITNNSSGTIDVKAPLEYGSGFVGGTLTNGGTIQLEDHQTFTVPDGGSSLVINGVGGQITNLDLSGVFDIGPQNTFRQDAGTTTPHGTNPSDPAVVVDGSNLGTTLQYTGIGVSTIRAQNLVNMSGSLAHAQSLVVYGVNDLGCAESVASAASSFSNAGTITLTGPCDSGLRLTSGTLTNTGTILTTAGASSRELKGGLINQGKLNISGPTAFDGTGATLTQAAGTTTIGPSQFLDMTHSNGFHLNGGLLQAPGSAGAKAVSITGSLSNSGGTVAPGSTTTPGDMTINGHYTQGAAGRLTAVIAGTQVGKTYSQLDATQGSTIGGTLNIVTHSGFTPTPNSLFTVLGDSGGTNTGKFAKLTGQFLPGGTLGYKPLYKANSVSLVATAAAKLTVKKAGSSAGTVTSSPAGIRCGMTCAAFFFKPQVVTLTEHPASGHTFKGWSGACTGKTTTCKVKMTQARSVTATFS